MVALTNITGSEALIESLLAEGIDTIFGYPGGQIMPVFDKLYDYQNRLRHILVRHEQGAVHAAQGFARASGRTGVVLVTSGPGATNTITGVADAMVDSTPLVVITGQVPSAMLGADAFQETDVLGITLPITKWSYQVRRPEDIAWAVARAFYIAANGRPGPVVLDFTKDAQVGKIERFNYEPCSFIRSYSPVPTLQKGKCMDAAKMLNEAKRPLIVYGQGVILSNAEEDLKALCEKTGIPAASTLLGLSALPSGFKHYKGMLGMHGNIGPNIMTNQADVILTVGMRFDDRVTGTLATYAKQAKIIHVDIDAAEIGKIVPVDLGIHADAKQTLQMLSLLCATNSHEEWEARFDACMEVETEKVINPEIHPADGPMNMGEVVDAVARIGKQECIVLTDVGQNQMMGARYSRFSKTRSLITSGGLGTMGFGLPAAMGAKVAQPDRPVVVFLGDGGVQMTIQELGTIMQEHLGVKIVILNNNWLGNVRQWQQLFFGARYSQTRMQNPDYGLIAKAYNIKHRRVSERAQLDEAIAEMLADNEPFVLEACVVEEGMVFPMIPPGKGVTDIMLNANEWYK